MSKVSQCKAADFYTGAVPGNHQNTLPSLKRFQQVFNAVWFDYFLPAPVPIFLTIHAYNFPNLLIEDTDID